uniref:Uncharacterized protein n=1 Tax=Triticum urartu TaxID=4572 RepID=A0A8R7R6T5_TRIUA
MVLMFPARSGSLVADRAAAPQRRTVLLRPRRHCCYYGLREGRPRSEKWWRKGTGWWVGAVAPMSGAAAQSG